MDNLKMEDIAMVIIANAGEARGLAFEALRAIRDEKDYAKAKACIVKAEEYSNIAHKAQTDLLVAGARGEAIDVDVLLVHSQDHLMTAMLAVELITEMIEFYKNK